MLLSFGGALTNDNLRNDNLRNDNLRNNKYLGALILVVIMHREKMTNLRNVTLRNTLWNAGARSILLIIYRHFLKWHFRKFHVLNCYFLNYYFGFSTEFYACIIYGPLILIVIVCREGPNKYPFKWQFTKWQVKTWQFKIIKNSQLLAGNSAFLSLKRPL